MAMPIAAATPHRTSVSSFEALAFAFKTEDAWSNILIAFVFSLIPLIGPMALLGWYAEIMARLAEGHPRPIPKLSFDDLMTYVNRGVAPFVVQLVAVLPLSVVIGGGFGVLGAVMSIISTSARHGRHGAPPIDPTVIAAIMIGAFVVMLCVMPFYGILTNAAATRAELVHDVGEGLRFGPIFEYAKATWSTTLVALFVYGFLSIVIVLLGLAACFVGIYPAAVIVRTGKVHLQWQIYERYLAQGGTPIPVKQGRAPLPSEQRR